MIPHAALHRPQYRAVLGTVAGEYFYMAVIHLYRDADFQSTFRLGDNSLSVGIQINQFACFFHRDFCHFKQTHL